MARDAESLKIGNTPWADTGDRTDPDDTALTPPIDRGQGWPASFSGAGGNELRRFVWNQIFREIYGMLVEINRHGGILEWDAAISYQHDPAAIVLGSDRNVYISVQSSTNQNPVNDSADTYWTLLITSTTLPAAVSQTAAEARTSTTLRLWSALRVGQAITAGLPASVSESEAEARTAGTARLWSALRVGQAAAAAISALGATLPAAVSELEAEARTSTTLRLWSALRVGQAIEALGYAVVRSGTADPVDSTGADGDLYLKQV